MGSCLSKKSTTTSPLPPTIVANLKLKAKVVEEEKKILQPEEGVKKEIFVIKQSRRSHDRHSETPPIEIDSASPTTSAPNVVSPIMGTAPIRTSSCTKEEVDAILIQCGRLSRSSSGKASGDRKYSGSKRSYDFDHENDVNNSNNDDDFENYHQHHHGHRHHSRPSHRRTPSREKDGGGDHKRSGSQDREERRSRSNGGGGSRRVSRSPGRRSETPTAPPSAAAPSKMVAVPARDKTSSIPESTTTTGIKRASVKRSGGGRTTSSPRSQSPANVSRGGSIENGNHPQQQSLSRNSSRKAHHSSSPYRRNPMNEIDDNYLKSNTVKSQDQSNNKVQRTKDIDQERTNKQIQKKTDERSNKLAKDVNNNKEEQIVEEPIQVKGLTSKLGEVVISNVVENSKPQTITRTRSSRRSRDLDINMGSNPDNILNPTSYASLLLEDIQNFHHQNTTAFSLPACVTKACSILDAVADLNSSTTPNNSSVLSESEGAASKNNNTSNSSNVLSIAAKKRLEIKDHMVEAEVEAFINDDVMEPESHLHKYITVRKRGEESEQQESSGSNSFAGQHWVSSSSWEPNSADSNDRWTSRSNTREESYDDVDVGARKMRSGNGTQTPASGTASGKKRELNHGHQIGARGHRTPIAAAAPSL